MAKVSVIVPVYNVEKYIKKCINSLIDQTLKDIEIILVDDGSPDMCPHICDQYAQKDARVKVIHKKNGGVGAARNDGLAIATGEYAIFCDSDDWMELDGCETLYNAACSTHADIAVADINRITGNECEYKKLFTKEFVVETLLDKDELMKSIMYPKCCNIAQSTIGYGGPWNKLIRREVLDKYKIVFKTNLKGVCDDRLHNAESYIKCNRIVYVQKAVYNYMLVENSITRSFKPDINEIDSNIYKEFFGLCQIYAPDGRWNEALYAMTLWRLEEALSLYFFNTKNRKGLYKKLKELKQTIYDDKFKKAVIEVDSQRLSKTQKLILLGIKMKSVLFIWMVYCMRNAIKR